MINKLKYYSVRAHSGRFNGEALFLTTSKKKAKELAKIHWLEFGVVDFIRTLEEAAMDFVESEVDKETIQNIIIDDYGYYMDLLKKEDDWVEIEWGT